MTNTDDIRTTGPVGLKGLSEEQRRRIKESRDRAVSAFRNRYNPQLENTSEVQRYSPDEGMYNWGTSKYDSPIQPQYLTSGEMQDTRHENQPWYDTLANGVGKMLGTAGTTFVSSLVGLPAGIATAIGENRWSGLWDNDVTNGLAKVDDWLEKNMTNYKSQEQEQNKWWQNMGSMNWWADDVIKNAGFTLGAAASMAVGSGALGLMSKSLGFVKELGGVSKGASNFLSALFSATGEGMIEARQGVDDRNKLQIQKLRDSFTPQYAALEEQQKLIDEDYALTQDYDTYRQRSQDLLQQKALLDNQWNNGVQEIEESGRKMGNMILLGNQALLTMGNLIQFGKTMTKSFDRARHAAEVSKKTAKPSYWMSTNRVSDDIKEGYKLTGKWPGRIAAGTKGIVTEGSEEMNQQWIQNTAGNYYNREDVNDYWRAKLSPGATKDTVEGLHTFGQALSQGFKDSWGDPEQWEQFVIGGLTGMAGSYAPTKLFNQDKSKAWYDPRRYGEWSGGAYNEIKEFNTEYNKQQENVDDLNKILASEDFPSRVSSMIGHTYMEGIKTLAADDGNKKAWKDADDKQNIIDIQAFLRAGKLDDLRAIYQEMAGNLSDEDVENIRKSTTKEISAEEDQQNHDRLMDEEIATHQRKIDELNSRIQQIADDRDMLESPEEITAYNNSVQPAIESLLEEVDKEQDAIYKLEQDKASYVGQKKYDGAFVDDKGNITATNDEIREEVKHNSEELNRKLDSYLESIDYVNKLTNGQLTKDQEDNLAYLHNMSKEKIVRFDKIMSEVRKQLPNKFLIKTTKTPEQLAQENASSDLAFSKNESTPKGYVEVDTSLMNDKTFGNFFMDTVMYGNNILPSEDNEDSKDESKEKKTVKQEQKEEQAQKDRDEQQNINVERYKKNFYDTMRQKGNMTLEEIKNAFEDLRKDIYDASVLRNDSQEFWNTYMDYMLNPQKVDEAKEEEEKKITEKKQKQDVQGMSVKELAQRADLKELLAQAKTDSNIPLINKIKKAMLIRQQKAKTSSAGTDKEVLSGYSPEDKEMAIKIQMGKLEKELDRVEEDGDGGEVSLQELTDRIRGVDVQDIDDAILEGLNPVERGRLARLSQEDPDAFEKEMAEKENTLLQALDELENHTLESVPDFDESRVEATDKDMQALGDKVQGENPKSPAEPKKHDEVNPVISVPVFSSEAPTNTGEIDSVHDTAALEQDMQHGIEGVAFERSGQHPWRAVTRRVGYKTNEPYSHTLERMLSETTDESKRKQLRKQLQRVRAVEKLLEEKGTFTRVEQGEVARNNVVRFAVSKKLNDEAGDFVILMIDINGDRILGDLPSSDIDIEPNTNQIQGLADLYEEAKKQWDSLTDEEKEVNELFILDGLTTKVDYTYFGKVRYQNERQSVNELFGNEPFTLALKIRGAEDSDSEPRIAVVAGKKALQGQVKEQSIRQPLSGTVGQPYVLIPTSLKNNTNRPGQSYLAVPILTPTFGEINKDSQFYQVVRDLLERIKEGRIQSKEAKELFKVLFGVDNVHINFEGDLTKKGAGITFTTFNRTNQSEKGNPHNIFKGNREDLDVDATLEALGRFFINISNKKINTEEPFYAMSNGTKVDYNRMIGEIATTNAATPHTVNDFFTVVPLEKKDGKFQQVENKPARMKFPQGSLNSVFHVRVKYKDGTQKMWSIDPSDNFACRDTQGRPITKNDGVHTKSEQKLAAQYRAEAFGRFYMKDFSRPFVVMIDDKAYIYDPINKTFKTVKELEKTAPRYDKNMSDYDWAESMLESMEEARLEAEETRAAAEAAKNNVASLSKFGPAITDYSYGAQDGLPTLYGTLPSTGERVRIEVNEENNSYDIWIDRAVPGQDNYKPGNGINYNIIYEEGEEANNKVIKELGLPQEFIDDLPKLHELNREDVRNSTDKKDEYLKDIWGIEYGHNAPNYKNINKVNAAIKKIQDDGTKYVVCDVKGKPDPEGDYYKDEEGFLYARVTSVAEGDPYVEPFKEKNEDGTDNPWILPSTTIGNQVDEFIRVFFEGGDPMTLNSPNLSQKSKENLLEDLREIQKSITKQGWKVASRDIVASGILGVTDANGDQIMVRVAGTLDLLLYNPEKDEYAIYDIKTHRAAIDFSNVENDSHMGKWSAQLSLYKEMLEAKYPELRGKIKGLKILPIKVTTDSYNANEHQYSKQGNTLVDENGKTVVAEFRYDGQTIPIKERTLKINMGKKGFKAAYNSEEGKKQIIVGKPQPKPGEAPKQRVKEGLLETINKIAADKPTSKYLKQEYKENDTALALCATLDEARKNGTLADLMLTEATMSMLSDMFNEKLINNHAAIRRLKLEGLGIPEEKPEPKADTPVVEDEEDGAEDLDGKARSIGILNSSTEKAWSRLTEENKRKAINSADVISIGRALQDAQKNPRKNPNQLVSKYLHRKAVETTGYTKLDITKELEWLNKVLPQLSRYNKIRIINGLIRCSDGTWDYGQLKNGLIYLGTNGKEGTVYHEAFHAVTQWILTDEELDALYEAARERYGNLDTVTLEEKMADDFMLYTMGSRPSYKPKHQNIFKRLWEAIKKMFRHTSMIDKLYQNISDGVYAGAVLRTNNNEFADINTEDREASMHYAFLDEEQRERLKEGEVSREQYEVLDSNEKRYLFHCVL